MSQAKTKTTEIGRPATGRKRDQQRSHSLNVLALVQNETMVSPESMPKRDHTMSQNIKNSAMSQAKTKTTEIGRPATGRKRDQQHIGPTEVTQKRPKTQATASRTKGQGHSLCDT